MNALENVCSRVGQGLNYRYLNQLREVACQPGVEERALASGGYSYFPSGSSSRGRLFKIAIAQDRLFIEFNKDLEFTTADKSFVYLNDEDREYLHAGGVKFCYVGTDFSMACRLMERIIQDYI